jgi:hypothetical protein
MSSPEHGHLPSPEQSEARRPISESVRELESLNIAPPHQVELLLILAGEKPATTFDSTSKMHYGGDTPEQRLARLNQVHHWAEQSGVPTEVVTEGDSHTVFVARDAVWLEKMKEADRTRDDRLLGECFGMPDTAIDAYIAGTGVPATKIAQSADVRGFGFFMMSPDHWPEESNIVERRAQAVKRLSPDLYDIMINTYGQPRAR